MAFAISNSETFQVIGINKDGTQHRLCSARTLPALLKLWTKEIERHEKTGHHNILPSFARIRVWNIDSGFGADLPYIKTVLLNDSPAYYSQEGGSMCNGIGRSYF